MRSIFAKIIFWLFTLTAAAVFGLGFLTFQNSGPTTPTLLVSWGLILYWSGARLSRIVMRQPSVRAGAEFDMADELISWFLTVFAALLFSIVLILIFSGKIWLSTALFFTALFPYWLANKDAVALVAVRRRISRVRKRLLPPPQDASTGPRRQQYGPVRRAFVSVLIRGNFTILFSLTALAWTHAVDENAWHQLAPYIFAGVLIDLVSNFTSPALSLSDAQLETLVVHSEPSDNLPKNQAGFFANIVWAIVLLGPTLATLVVIYAQRWQTAHVMTLALGDSQFIDALLPYFKFAETHVAQMHDQGASERIGLMFAVYAANLLTFACAFIFIIKLWISLPPRTIQNIYVYGKTINSQRAPFSPLTSLILLMCFFQLIAIVLNIFDFAPTNLTDIHYVIHANDFAFLWFSLFLTGLLGFIWFIRFGTIALRLSSLGLWGEKAVNGQTKVPNNKNRHSG